MNFILNILEYKVHAIIEVISREGRKGFLDLIEKKEVKGANNFRKVVRTIKTT